MSPAASALADLLTALADGVCTLDAEGYVTAVNPAFARLADRAAADLVGRSAADLFAPADDGAADPAADPRLTSSHPWHGPRRLLLPDGSMVETDAVVTPLHDADGHLIGRLELHRRPAESTAASERIESAPITDRTRFELEAALRNLTDGIIIAGPDGRIRLANPSFQRMFSLPQDRLVGRPVAEAIRNTRLVDLLAQPLSAPEANVTTDLPMINGKTLTATSSAIIDDRGRVIGTVAVLRDVTRDREADKLKADFVSTVSHELRTPLTSIKSFTHILLQHSDSDRLTPEKKLQFLRILDEEADRLTRLINDVLDLSRMEAGKMPWRRVAVSLPEVVSRVRAVLNPIYDEHRVQLLADIPEPVPTLFGDTDRLFQLVTNLLANAVKFTPEGGSVTVGLSAISAAEATVEHRPTADADVLIQLTITDTGIGVPDGQHERIFGKFSQIMGEDAMDKPSGTGLGLAISRHIVEHHGGTIWAEPNPDGVGTRFVALLPVVKADAAAEPEPKARSVDSVAIEPRHHAYNAPRGQNVVLVVDDNEHIRKAMKFELERRNYLVIEASGGAEAVALARHYHPDIITLDLMMPDLSGFDVIAILKQDRGVRDIPIVMVSVLDEVERGFALGAQGYVTKPIDLAALTEQVDSLIGANRRQLLILTDDDELWHSFEARFTEASVAVQHAATPDEVRRCCAEATFDAVVVDGRLPELREIVSFLNDEVADAETLIVVLSTKRGGELPGRVLSVGSVAYLDREREIDDLYTLVSRHVHGGER